MCRECPSTKESEHARRPAGCAEGHRRAGRVRSRARSPGRRLPQRRAGGPRRSRWRRLAKRPPPPIAHQPADPGRFTYDTPVAELWPEFGAHGKQAVTMRQVLNHTAGVPGIPLDTTVEDLCDWDRMCAAIADAELWWET